MENYTKAVSRVPPEGLWESERDRLDTYGIIYSKEFIPAADPDSVIGAGQGKTPAVRCRCSACGEEFYRPWARTAGPDGAAYGFIETGSGGVFLVGSGDSMECPVCGTHCCVKCASRIRSDINAGTRAFITAETGAMSAQLLPGNDGERPLVLICWKLRRYCTHTGGDLKVILPADAYVFAPDGRSKLTGSHRSYSGTAGYFMVYKSKWDQPKDWHSDWGRQDRIYGLTPELTEKSCLRNSRLWEYMQDAGINSAYPVEYLSLWQEHPQVENLAAQGAGYLLSELTAERNTVRDREDNRRGLFTYDLIDFGQRRPSAMLGLTREEFRRMTGHKWSAGLLRLYLARKRAGELLTDEDIENVFMLGGDLELGKMHYPPGAGAGKAARYLLRQIECAEYRYDHEIDEYCDPEEYYQISAGLLRDYWDMAGHCGWDLRDPAVRWPKDLEAAHDRAAEAERTILDRQSAALFRKRYKELKKYSFAHGGIRISPCATQDQLTREGSTLHHCVAGYAHRVARGETSIFFIRREKAPRTPWYTLEFDEKNLVVRQNRGKRNCARTPEVKAFEQLWLSWIHDGCPRDGQGEPVINDNREAATA